MDFNNAVQFLKSIEEECDLYVSYTYVNDIEFEFDLLTSFNSNNMIRGFDTNSNELVDVIFKEYVDNIVINSFSFEVQVPCEFEFKFIEKLKDNGLAFVFYETYLAPDCASRDYSVYRIN